MWRERQPRGQILNIHCRRIELLLPDRNIEIVACSRRSSRNRGAKVASKRTENKTRAETESSPVVSKYAAAGSRKTGTTSTKGTMGKNRKENLSFSPPHPTHALHFISRETSEMRQGLKNVARKTTPLFWLNLPLLPHAPVY